MTENENYLYHARELQVVAIKNDTAESLRREMLICVRNRSSEALSLLLNNAPHELPKVIKGFADSEKTFCNLAYFAAVATSKRDFILDTLNRLLKACSMDSRGFKEVLMDGQGAKKMFDDFKYAFPDTDTCMDIIGESHFHGTRILLQSLQGDVPLAGYKRKIIGDITNLSQLLDGGEIGYLKTKVSSINLKLWYPKDDNFPKLSFTVEDIAQPS